MRKRTKQDMQYERDLMEQQQDRCAKCHQKIFRGETIVIKDGQITHGNCKVKDFFY